MTPLEFLVGFLDGAKRDDFDYEFSRRGPDGMLDWNVSPHVLQYHLLGGRVLATREMAYGGNTAAQTAEFADLREAVAHFAESSKMFEVTR